jgi:hypothetical protein
MNAFLLLVTRFFDALFWPFRSVAPIWGLLVVSLLTGILMLVIFRYTSNQKAIKTIKDRLKAHLLALWLFQDQIGVVFRTQGRLLYSSLVYTRHTLIPLAVMLVPLVLIMVQLEVRFGQSPVHPGDPFLLTAQLNQAADVERTALSLPPGLNLTAPPIHLAASKEVNWRIDASRAGQYQVQVVIGDQPFAKQVVVGEGVAVLSPRRSQGGLLDALLNPTEPKLPADAPLSAIEVAYPSARVAVASWRMHWLIPFFVFTLLSALAFRGVLKTEF